MKYFIAALVGGALLAGCTYAPSEFYGIRQAVPEQQAKYADAPLHTTSSAATTTAHNGPGVAAH